MVLYLVLAMAALLFYPGVFTPGTSWLSDLGNRVLNPGGAWLYRAAGILGGAALGVFFLSLPRLEPRRGRVRTLLGAAAVFGAGASACFALTGVFSEDMMPMHSWFSIGLFACFGTAVALTAISILVGAPLPRWLVAPCLATWAADIMSGVFGQARFLEWVVVALLIACVSSISISRLRARGGGAGPIVAPTDAVR